MKYVIYEVWTRSRVVEAKDYEAALNENEPKTEVLVKAPDADEINAEGKFEVDLFVDCGLSLSNWHAQPVDGPDPGPQLTGALDSQNAG